MAEFLWFLPAAALLFSLLALLRSRFLARERRALFTAVAALGRATEMRLAEKTRWPHGRVRRGLAGLEKRGFVERAGDEVRVAVAGRGKDIGRVKDLRF